jgi:hypothetical protein
MGMAVPNEVVSELSRRAGKDSAFSQPSPDNFEIVEPVGIKCVPGAINGPGRSPYNHVRCDAMLAKGAKNPYLDGGSGASAGKREGYRHLGSIRWFLRMGMAQL